MSTIDISKQDLWLLQDPYSNQDPSKHLCLNQVQLLLTNLSEIASTEKKDGKNHSFKSNRVYEISQDPNPEVKLHTYNNIINDEIGYTAQLIVASLVHNIRGVIGFSVC